ncbi:MAG: hypothetical protein ACRCXZ_06160 [Patescibacteria group bacterium]
MSVSKVKIGFDPSTYCFLNLYGSNKLGKMDLILEAIMLLDDAHSKAISRQSRDTDEIDEDDDEDNLSEEELQMKKQIQEIESLMEKGLLHFSSISPDGKVALSFLNKTMSNDIRDLEFNMNQLRDFLDNFMDQDSDLLDQIGTYIMTTRGVVIDSFEDPFGHIEFEQNSYQRLVEMCCVDGLFAKSGLQTTLIRFSRQLAMLEKILPNPATARDLFVFHMGQVTG